LYNYEFVLLYTIVQWMSIGVGVKNFYFVVL